MRLGVVAVAVSTCLLGIPPAASAQDGRPAPGDRVRMTVPCDVSPQPAPERLDPCVLVGRLAAWRADAIDLETEGGRRSYNPNAVSRLEVSLGMRSKKRLGAGIGLLAGVVGSYVLFHSGGSTGMCNQSANQDAIESRYCIGIYALGGLAGAGLGALIGGAIKSERWQDVTHGPVRISVAAPGRLTLRLAVAF